MQLRQVDSSQAAHSVRQARQVVSSHFRQYEAQSGQ